ncbi:hypothetical protein [Nocardia sp. NPDC046763]|uniref:hypothetical protein n=1 Tax=Nocardia sp. NPDC046763 TaxID=3155256 RepID=UPI0033BFEAF3
MSTLFTPRHSWLHLGDRHIEAARWDGTIKVAKFNPETVRQVQHDLNNGVEPIWEDFVRHEVQPDSWTDEHHNQLVTVGLNLLTQLFEGAGGNAFNHSNAIVGVGSSSTAWTAADVHLGGDGSSASAYYQQADTGYPTQSNGVITCYCTFGSGNANFAWNEWCLADGTSITGGSTLSTVATGVVMINHKIASLGTKSSGASWTAH